VAVPVQQRQARRVPAGADLDPDRRPLPQDQPLPGMGPRPDDFKALTVHQPWASLIAEGVKLVENRARWLYRHRGPLLIHAGADTAIDWDALADPMVAAACGVTPPGARLMDSRFPCSTLLAVVHLVDVHVPAAGCCRSPYARPDAGAHLVFTDPRPLLRRVPARGYQGLWTPNPALQHTVHTLLEAA
jgi:hypothetical protein